jgi:hypothetical protein
MTDDNIRHLGHVEPPAFPLMDSTREISNAEYHRDIQDNLGYVEPYLSEVDNWCSMPVRVSHNTAAGWHIELGPYDLDRADIELLRRAIAAYDRAAGR